MIPHIENINDILALHFAHEQLTEEQERVLIGWMIDHKDEYDKLSRIMSDSQVDTAGAWSKVNARLARTESRAGRFWVKKVLSLAACILLVVGVSLYFVNRKDGSGMLYANAGTELMTVTLPDSSSVVLYSGSSVKYLAVASERKVELEGKAFFKVRRNEQKPFTVQSGEAEIRVLGTSFLVSRLQDDQTEVFVREGLVQVASPRTKVLLHANEQAKVKGTDIDKDVIAHPETVFESHIVRKTYRDVPLSTVVRDIENEFKVEIEVGPSLSASRINTTFNFVQIEEILSELSYICDCKYEKISDRKYKLMKP